MNFAALIVFSYLLGSVPFSLIIARAHGKDLRAIGSGNIGATNLSRALGKKWAYPCFLLDVAKGLIPMLIAGSLVSDPPTVSQLWLWLITGCAAVCGHIFPVYLKFKGGKGMATSLGFVLGLCPYYTIPGLITFIIWLTAVLIWRYISLASIIASAAFPAILLTAIAINKSWQFKNLWPLTVMALIIPILIILRHKENIKRIKAGTETKVMHKKGEKSLNV